MHSSKGILQKNSVALNILQNVPAGMKLHCRKHHHATMDYNWAMAQQAKMKPGNFFS